MRVQRLVSVGLFLLLPIATAMASSFTGITAFGDSLTDNGNAYLISHGTYPGSNYGSYTFSNGLTTKFFSDGPNTTPAAAGPAGLWIDQLASKLGVADPLPSFASGTNYAIASAQTGTTNPQDVGYQLALFTSRNLTGASPTDLYAFWAGANDILDGNSPVTAADNIEGYIKTLHSEGAQDFLWLNLPPLGDTPEGRGNMAALNAASVQFNTEYASDLAALQSQGIHVTGVNIYNLFEEIASDPGRFGFTNITAAAQGQNLPNDAGYLSWDGLHPTTQGHAQIADAAYNALVPVATPEPGAVGLLFAGTIFIGVTGLVRRRASRHHTA